MRAKAVEIRWHNTQPIFSCDFQPTPYRCPDAVDTSSSFSGWRLATAGADNHVRLWLVRPGGSQAEPESSSLPPKPSNLRGAHVEYLASLSKHSAVVNVVRWSPSGDMLASAADDGCIILWMLSDKPSLLQFGETAEDRAYEKESWRIQKMLRASGGEIYDLAWSPNGEYIIAGATDNTARIFSAVDGQLLKQIVEHNNYVQGVAWDPLGRYLATQSSDRHMHVYSYDVHTHPNGTIDFQVQMVGKNHRMNVDHSATHAWVASGASIKTESHVDDDTIQSDTSTTKGKDVDDASQDSFKQPRAKRTYSDRSDQTSVPPTPTLSRPQNISPSPAPSTSPSVLNPSSSRTKETPLGGLPSSRRSSFSATTAPLSPTFSPQHHSPQHHLPSQVRHARSPSPMAPLPAVRTPLSPTTSSMPLYGGQEVSPFFRRLCWSTDGSLLLTPAGWFEDPFIPASSELTPTNPSTSNNQISRPKKKKKLEGNCSENPQEENPNNSKETSSSNNNSNSSRNKPKPTAYIYSRSNIGKAPIAHLPGHRTNSVAIRFSPIVWQKRTLCGGSSSKDSGGGSNHPPPYVPEEPVQITLERGVEKHVSLPRFPSAPASTLAPASGYSDNNESGNEPTIVDENEKEPSAFDLSYRMMYAVVTHDTALIYDTQQAAPICLVGNLHYAPFTDLTWSPDGATIVLSSQDGYCSIVTFEEEELGVKYSKQAAKIVNMHRYQQPPHLPQVRLSQDETTSKTAAPAHSRTSSSASIVAPPTMPTPVSETESFVTPFTGDSSATSEKKSKQQQQPVVNQLTAKKKKRIQPTLLQSHTSGSDQSQSNS